MPEHEASASDVPAEFHTLSTVEVFTGDRIGAVGLTPPHLVAWRALLAHERADQWFKQLIDSATLAGQLYALAGVYFTDRLYLARVVPRYKTSTATVKTVFTCFVGDTPIRDIATQIESGELPEHLRGTGVA